MYGLERTIAFQAAELRGAYRLGLVDAVHLATAMVAGSKAFVTNDRELLRAADAFAVLLIDDLIDSPAQ